MPYNFLKTVFKDVLRLRRNERKWVENLPFLNNAVALIQSFRFTGSPPNNHFCMVTYGSECLTSLLVTVVTLRNFVTDFVQAKCDFSYPNRPFCVFRNPFGGLKGNL